LDIQYASADKAKTSFGYIGITFLTVLFGSIFLNDFIKFCIYYFGNLSDYRMKRSQNNKDTKDERDEAILEVDQIYANELDKSLEKVYFKLVKANAKNKNKK
jgi:hypothetical protein